MSPLILMKLIDTPAIAMTINVKRIEIGIESEMINVVLMPLRKI